MEIFDFDLRVGGGGAGVVVAADVVVVAMILCLSKVVFGTVWDGTVKGFQ